ncbi:MAG TPA: PilZ domain-containing protein [Candidatus Acidoferrum sp.]|nr:PilZ domain-containing protein [Candidatus Acidoferrum sp.]
MHDELRGLRFPFDARAEVSVDNSPEKLPARVAELSLRGCRLEMSGTLAERLSVQVRVFNSGETFEAPATIIYVKPSGVGLMFGDIKPHFREVLQNWILAEVDKQAEGEPPQQPKRA